MKPIRLSKELKLSPEEVVRLLNEIKEAAGVGRSEKDPTGVSALDMFVAQQNSKRQIITFCESLDRVLGGGVALGEITEFCGSPGCGKTQLGIQLAVDTCIPESFGGVDGEVMYVDTEGSFDIQRVIDMSKALLKHLERNLSLSLKRKDPSLAELQARQRQELDKMNSIDHMLSRIHYCRIHNYTEQLAFINAMPSLLKKHPLVKLIVLDSVAFHFRHDFENMAKRARLLNAHAQKLNMLASNHQLAVVVTNQMTTRLQTSGGKTESYLVPALGESWSHAITSRVVLSVLDETVEMTKKRKANDGSKRYDTERVYLRKASLVKSPSKQQQTIEFVVTKSGIRNRPKVRHAQSHPAKSTCHQDQDQNQSHMINQKHESK